jgi:predicted nucleic-acid-binding Zn-ribbon protein
MKVHETKLKYESSIVSLIIIERSVMKCTKCEAEMVKATATVFGDIFGCTRRDLEKLEELNMDKVQPYYCKNCGYMEFYKEVKKK